jgi:2-phospho-L-lactate guanylyltransferase
MSVWLVLPMKSLRDGKTRLSSVLDPQQRHDLLEYLLLRTLNRAAEFPGLPRTLVVSACAETRARAADLGARVLAETPGVGLNGALREAQLEVRRADVRNMLVVPCDLPLLEADDLQALAQAASAQCVAIAPDEAQRGTNGLCFDAMLEFGFSFGLDSYARHLEQIRQLGLQHLAVENPRLAFDLDLAQDLARLGTTPRYARAEGESQ